MIKCQLCKRNPAEWAMQYIGEDTPTFTTLGSHYRGFRAVKVCNACKEEQQPSVAALTPAQLLRMVVIANHDYQGECPAEDTSPESRDPECLCCQAIVALERYIDVSPEFAAVTVEELEF